MEDKYGFRGWFVVEVAKDGRSDFRRIAQFAYEYDAAEWMEVRKSETDCLVFKMHFEPSLEYLKGGKE